jgi:signal recognition particle receptor subunit beta
LSFINYAAKEINCKVIYYGPGLSGKTTNIQFIYEHTASDSKGKLVNLSSENERTLFFDFLPLSVGEIQGFKTRFHLYSIPGQTFYEISRQFILKGVDGIVFVADSDAGRMDANQESNQLLERSLEQQGYDPLAVPTLFQYNKRDLPQAVSIAELNALLNKGHKPVFEAIANQGKGVIDSLNAITQMVIKDLQDTRRKK